MKRSANTNGKTKPSEYTPGGLLKPHYTLHNQLMILLAMSTVKIIESWHPILQPCTASKSLRPLVNPPIG